MNKGKRNPNSKRKRGGAIGLLCSLDVLTKNRFQTEWEKIWEKLPGDGAEAVDKVYAERLTKRYGTNISKHVVVTYRLELGFTKNRPGRLATPVALPKTPAMNDREQREVERDSERASMQAKIKMLETNLGVVRDDFLSLNEKMEFGHDLIIVDEHTTLLTHCYKETLPNDEG